MISIILLYFYTKILIFDFTTFFVLLSMIIFNFHSFFITDFIAIDNLS